jgi:hypothetical protein
VEDRFGVDVGLSALRFCQAGNHADERVHILLQMHPLSIVVAAQSGRLLRILVLRLSKMPTDSGTAKLLWLAYVVDR